MRSRCGAQFALIILKKQSSRYPCNEGGQKCGGLISVVSGRLEKVSVNAIMQSSLWGMLGMPLPCL